MLGWSAFAGLFVMLLVWPLNSYLSARAIKIEKELLKAEDKRMSILNELLGAVGQILEPRFDTRVIFLLIG